MAAEAYGRIWDLALGHATPYAVKAAIKLGLFNIISKSQEGRATLDEILEGLREHHDDPQRDKLHQLLRFLVVKKVLSLSDSEGSSPCYGLTRVSKLLVSEGNDMFLGSLITQVTEGWKGWEHIDTAITGGNAFVKAIGMDPKKYMAEHPEFVESNERFRVATNKAAFAILLEEYDGFKNLKKLVDVGGGRGSFVALVVKAYPHIEGVNFDLPQALEDCSAFPGVKNIAGDAMESIPSTDGIFIKNVVHMFADAAASKLLTNCYNALEHNGKLIICDMVLEEDKEQSLQTEILFLAGSAERFERTEEQWRSLLTSCGFADIKFFFKGIPTFSIIEATKR